MKKKNVIYTPRVQVSQYGSMADQKLAGEMRKIIAAVKAKPEDYAAVKTNFDAFTAQFDKFELALAEASTNATPAINVKNYERKLLIVKINEFGLALAANCNGDSTYITNTTMTLVVVPAINREPQENQIPEIKAVANAEKNGSVIVTMARLKKPSIIVAMEYKTDDMTEWKNGRYFNRTSIMINDLPRLTDVSFRFFAIDGLGNKSGFTNVFVVSVS